MVPENLSTVALFAYDLAEELCWLCLLTNICAIFFTEDVLLLKSCIIHLAPSYLQETSLSLPPLLLDARLLLL